MNCFILNLLIAAIWLFLQNRPNFAAFVVGFLIGYVLIRLFPGVLDSRDYTRRTRALALFICIFTRQFLVACVDLIRTILFRRTVELRPRIITYNVAGLTRLEILLLAHCISLTPGSSCVGVAEDEDELVLHVLDTRDPAAVRHEIDHTLRRGILAVTR